MEDHSKTPVILKGGGRTPIGRFLGGFSPLPAPRLAASTMRAAVARSGIEGGEVDEAPRRDTTVQALAKLRPAFPKDAPEQVDELVVTAGNAPGLNDGAATLVVCSLEDALAHGLDVEVRITAYVSTATEPRDLFFAPVNAVRWVMDMEGKETGDYGMVELNEAFAVQAIAAMVDLDVETGLAARCLGGGNAAALSVARMPGGGARR